ncbi:hypothetical protein HDE_03031 [Halotydeus destructor]|nr:hypothetical protein HDE_03031 [Halotydeus destructor]
MDTESSESMSPMDTSDSDKSSLGDRSDECPSVTGSASAVTIVSFLESSNCLRMSYSAHAELFLDTLASSGNFEGGKMLRTAEKGVVYPVLHFQSLHLDADKLCLLHRKTLGSEFNLYQAVYEEMDCITLPVISRTIDCLPVYLIIGFRSFNSAYNRTFEENWKDLTGARTIYLNLSPEVGPSKLCFLKRIKPNDINTFVYILYVICTTVTEQNKYILLDFTQRLRLRMLGHLALYNVVGVN